MSEPLSEFIIVFAFGALCFGCGYLLYRDAHQIPQRNDKTRCRPLRLGDRQMGMGKAGFEILNAARRFLPPLCRTL
jgi:hypothetical protein